MAPALWWKTPYQAPSAEAATAFLKLCAICGNNALHRCKNCSGVGYCGRACQRKHWPEHKKECATLKARTLAVTPKTNTNGAAAPTAPARTQSNAVIPIATTELYSYDTFIQNWKSISLSNRVPCGIFNLGNTCYINAILQVLFATRPFAAYLLTNEHTCPRPAATLYSNAKKQWCPLCCLVSLAQEVFKNSSQSHGAAGGTRISNNGGFCNRDPLSIRSFTHFVQSLNSSFTFGDQHDAQELYVALLDAIECVFLRENEAKTADGADVIKKMDQFSKETTLMNHVFTCYTRTQVECTMCGKISKSYATDTGIMLSVPEEGKLKKKNSPSHSLENLLENFTAVEILEGDDAYRCDACCARVKAHKSNVIEIAPNILAIQLSRVGMDFFSAGEEAPQKNSAAVEFPLELDLTPFMALDALDAAPAVYELYAVVTHEGSTTEDGHYISVVRYGGGDSDDGGGGGGSYKKEDGQWYVCDDDVISPLSVDVVLKQQEEAYLLFYERKQPRMPQLLGGGDGDATDISNGATAEIIEDFTATQEEIEEVKPCAASGTEEEDEEEENSVSYVFEMGKNADGARALGMKVCLPSVDDDPAAEPQLDLKPGKPVFAEVRCGGCMSLNLPLPVQVELPAKKLEWNKDEKTLHVLFNAL